MSSRDRSTPREYQKRTPHDAVAEAEMMASRRLDELQARLVATGPSVRPLAPTKPSSIGVLNTTKRSKLSETGPMGKKKRPPSGKPPTLPPPRIKKEAPAGEVESLLAEQEKVLRVPIGPASGALLRSTPKNLESLPPQDKRRTSRKKPGAQQSTEEGEEEEMLTPFHFLERIRNQKSLEFVYLVPVVRDTRDPFNPYDLRIVPHGGLETDDYFTMSSSGVTHFRGGEAEFTGLEQWRWEHDVFYKILAVPFFKKYRSWKAFYYWKYWIRSKKRNYCSSLLSSSLFPLDPILSNSLLVVRKVCYDISQLRFYKGSRGKTHTLETIASAHETMTRQLMEKVRENYDFIRVTVQNACEEFMRKDDQISETGDDKDGFGKLGGGGLDGDGSSMTYTQLSQKRAKCRRLYSYIRLCDYLIVDALMILLRESVRSLNGHLQTLYDKYHAEKVDEEEKSEEDEEVVGYRREDVPLFMTQIVFENDSLSFVPSGESFFKAVDELTNDYVKTVASIDRLVASEEFQSYVQHALSDKREETELQEGTSVAEMVADDVEYNALIQCIRKTLTDGFNDAEQYVVAFESHRKMFLENRKMDIHRIREENHSLDFFREAMAKYKQQHADVEAMSSERDCGVFSVDSSKLRETFLPSPANCLKNIQDLLPVLAKAKNEDLLSELSDANKVLGSAPSSVEEFVDFLNFQNDIGERIEELETKFQGVSDIYKLMEEQKIKIPPDEYTHYSTGTVPTFSLLKTTLQFVEDSRDDNITKFADDLDRTIEDMKKDAERITEDTEKPQYDDPGRDPRDILEELEEFVNQLTEYKDKSKSYQDYQEMFGRPVADFGDLDDAIAAINLRHKLFKSIIEWNEKHKEWHDTPFMKIGADDMNTEVQRYSKVVFQVQKGLPDSKVVPLLKRNVDEMKLSLPVISSLLNPDLKPRHWEAIQEIIGPDVDLGEDVTLGSLLEMKVMEIKDEIGDVSLRATQEANLENLLKKVAGEWAKTEFLCLPYKESRDTFILGGVDDVIQQLEDSQLTVITIQGSRYVGPIKRLVDQWYDDLRLMSDTLDEWLNCQKNWLYLESIFSAEDIKKQLQTESKMFTTVDTGFRDIMRKTNDNPNVHRSLTTTGVLEKFKTYNELLEKIEKGLEDYLEKKRAAFPRFYFLSNDDLLDILSQTANPLAVQPHMSKCFDNIKSLEFGSNNKDIIAMFSSEGERVTLGKNLRARNLVEGWLKDVEGAMMRELQRFHKLSVEDFPTKKREDWLFDHAAQVVLNISQVFWCRRVEECLQCEDSKKALQDFYDENVEGLIRSAALTRTPLSKLQRGVLSTLIVIDVHARDILAELISDGVSRPTDFGWIKQLRYYWDTDEGELYVRQTNSNFRYGYEYLGCQPRLVITPLTDRICMTLTGALHLHLGGAPSGPAGTGKTETTKDLAKSLGRQCVVFNCSEGVTFKMMAKFFAGLIQTGAWICFDEFNRINIEVLSVIASQILSIRNALLSGNERVIFEGREMPIKRTLGIFITMNPGYAGRTELPDNLKVLFRPVAVMIPDYRMIAEVILFSEGFENARGLSQKMTQLYKLSSEQLSSQDHYDFGMRAVKSVLVMAGSLKRSNPDINEDVLLIRAMRDSNIPKFLAHDVPLFQAIIQDLFPGVFIPEHDYGDILVAIEKEHNEGCLQKIKSFITKIIQLYETMNVRHGVMLVGPTGGGKTTSRNILARSLTRLRQEFESDNPNCQVVRIYELNPKSISYGELYGSFNLTTHEWSNGILPLIAHKVVADQTPDRKWIVFDGPVDTLWIESMNSVLDDSKLLCLDNGDRIKLTNEVNLLFEVQDLAVASPATVSRCGMVYMDPENLGWKPIVLTWSQTTLPKKLSQEKRDFLGNLFVKHLESGLAFIRKECKMDVMTVDVNLVQSCLDLFVALLNADKMVWEDEKLDKLLNYLFAFSYVWSLGGNVTTRSQENFDAFVRDEFDGLVGFPGAGMVYDYFVDYEQVNFRPWADVVQEFKFNPKVPFFQILVPTIDTVRYSFLLTTLVNAEKPILFNGNSGVGKTMIVEDCLTRASDKMGLELVSIQFSAQTSSGRTQEMIESKLEKKRKNVLGAPPNKKVVMFVDDLNMPQLEKYGAQPPIELLRQMIGTGGFYDRKKLFFKFVQDVRLVGACGPPGGGRNPTTPRLLRLFHLLCVPDLSESSMKAIFEGILCGFLEPFATEVKGLGKGLVGATIELYHRISEDLRPTPSKSHYVFNLRDLSKVIQGIMQVRTRIVSKPDVMVRLWLHESMRAFHDRLVSSEDRNMFREISVELMRRHLGTQSTVEDTFEKPIWFGDFMKMGVPREERNYEPLNDHKKLLKILEDYMDDYNLNTPKQLNLVFFNDAVNHILRIARILRQPRGNGLLVGVAGCGKQSLTRLAAAMNEYKLFQIELSRGYGVTDFHEDLKNLYVQAGVENSPIVFLLSDSQIVEESFLEDVNNLLNSGEVPNLFPSDEKEKIIGDMRPLARDAGFGEGRDAAYKFFIHRVRENLHIVLCMSPVGEAFRTRVRMFPSLVNCCTIDWFDEWPDEALLSVARRDLEFVDVGSDELRDSFAAACVDIHSSVASMAHTFYEELRRRFYVTPTSYLEFIKLYSAMLEEKRVQLGFARDRLQNGVDKLKETNAAVTVMKKDLQDLQPVLQKKNEEVKDLLVRLSADTEKANATRKVVAEEEEIVSAQAAVAKKKQEDADADLNKALPILRNAEQCLRDLSKSDMVEVRSYAQPPELVKLTIFAVMTLFGEKSPTWEGAKPFLSKSDFISSCLNYDKDNISPLVIKKLQKYYDDPKFEPSLVGAQSKAAESLCSWCRAMYDYYFVAKEVEPKRQAAAAAQQEADQMIAQLEEKQAALKMIEDELNELQETYERTVQEKQDLEDKLDISAKRLQRADKLMGALSDEYDRWVLSVEGLTNDIAELPASVFLSSACIAYNGPFTMPYRKALVAKWRESCLANGVEVDESFSFIKTMSDPVAVREWHIWGLPTDDLSVENGILVTRTQRWPLMIDPQGQANKWVKSMEAKNGLKLIKRTEAANALRTLENAIRIGQPVLMEDVGSELDPALDPLLMKQTFKQGQRTLIRLGDSDIDYDPNFRFYMTTKLPNPHYLPEVCIKVALVNFTVTTKGLEDQLLADVVRKEKPELEEKNDRLITSMAADQKQLKDIEDRILKMLSESEGELLDNVELIDTLNDAKVTAGVIQTRMEESKEMEKQINASREEYRPVAIRGSILYFVMADLSLIDPMYQYSLEYFKKLFNLVIEVSEKSDVLEDRLSILDDSLTETVYSNVCRGLFEKHKIIFSFLICVKIIMQKGIVSEIEWNFLMRGQSMVKKEGQKANPDPSVFSEKVWDLLNAADKNLSSFEGIVDDFISHVDEWRGYMSSEEPQDICLPTTSRAWEEELSGFQRLILLKVLRSEKFFLAATQFVMKELGEKFVVSPPFDLSFALADSTAATPIIFVLSVGADPTSALLRFAKDQKFEERMHILSLGQGQGPNALRLIEQGRRSGDWVMLQNCHLGVSFMPDLERVINELEQQQSQLSPTFRLWLTSMPSKDFPIPVLQNGVKLTTEPPKGLRANVLRSYQDLSSAYVESFKERSDNFPECSRDHAFKKLLFGLCFFHGVIQERKKFGPLGWNIKYEFNTSDLEVSQSWLKIFLEEQPLIPWDSLRYVIGEVNYGGRVTDSWDRRCIMTILEEYFKNDILDDAYRFSPSGTYYVPETGPLSLYQEYIKELPLVDKPEIFGMHENANITFQVQESGRLMDTILLTQPRSSGGGGSGGKKPEVLVEEISNDILSQLPELLREEEAGSNTFIVLESGLMHSLSTVLLHEMERFNKLLKVMKRTLVDLQKALKGLVVLSADLDHMFSSLIDSKVPALWEGVAYPSLKPLGSWVKDLVKRVEFVRHWLVRGLPSAFWLSGFFFPQGFMTGVLQTHARKYNIPIDTLNFEFRVLDKSVDDLKEKPEDGVYVYGLFMDGARWSWKDGGVTDPIRGEMFSEIPPIWFLPKPNYETPEGDYSCPLYKTSVRAGTLSTTGHSTNFVLSVDLPSQQAPSQWVLRGVALLCQLDS